jgi:hypothetical protein
MKTVDSFDLKKKRAKRLNTRLESEAAEFLVLGHLLLLRIASYKTYTNLRGYDLVAIKPESDGVARIQVKSRWQSDADGFPIKNFECDFVVFARLNRGKKGSVSKERPPEFFVFPCEVVKAACRGGNWSKVYLRDIEDPGQYRDAWKLIDAFLSRKKRRAT